MCLPRKHDFVDMCSACAWGGLGGVVLSAFGCRQANLLGYSTAGELVREIGWVKQRHTPPSPHPASLHPPRPMERLGARSGAMYGARRGDVRRSSAASRRGVRSACEWPWDVSDRCEST